MKLVWYVVNVHLMVAYIVCLQPAAALRPRFYDLGFPVHLVLAITITQEHLNCFFPKYSLKSLIS